MLDKVADFLTPTSIAVERFNTNHFKVTLEPFERGYGYTLGNALRRILLSSLEGYAVTGIKRPQGFRRQRCFHAVPLLAHDGQGRGADCAGKRALPDIFGDQVGPGIINDTIRTQAAFLK